MLKLLPAYFFTHSVNISDFSSTAKSYEVTGMIIKLVNMKQLHSFLTFLNFPNQADIFILLILAVNVKPSA